MASIEEIQQHIADEFALLKKDREMMIVYIMELGQKLPPMPKGTKNDDNLIKGCQSKVWLTASLAEGKVYLQADSNTDITKGLVSLLIRIFSGQSPDSILKANLTFIKDIGMEQFIGSQRSSGLAAMIKQMKLYALALKTQISAP